MYLKAKKRLNHFTWLIFSLILFGCAAEKNNPMSNSFHNLTAHYNAYFIANERIKEVEDALLKGQKWNYDKVLPVFPQFDTAFATTVKTQIKDCIEKASIAIQRHKGSNWEDDSYILVGKARYFSSQFPEAVETFKYVNTHSKDKNARHLALTDLMRTFTENKEYKNAQAVIDYLKKEKLTDKNKRNFHLNAAYLFQKTDYTEKLIEHLDKACKYLKNDEKSRIHFTLGQLYQKANEDSAAYKNYKKTLSSNPSYELSFYTKLYMAQVTNLSEASDIDKIRKYFKKLIKDPKNKEYLDKIYYELAGFELKNNNIDEAIKHYKTSTEVSEANKRQKAYSFWALGKVYYEKKRDFSLAKNYYDSTVATMPKDEEVLPKIKSKQEILKEFVKHILVIEKNDSLLHLATLPKDSLKVLFTEIVKKEVAEQKKKKEKAKKEANRRALSLANNNQKLINTSSQNSSWYFANSSAISRGKSSFIRKWGDIKLEDNWRRQDKQANINNSKSESESTTQKEESKSDKKEEKEINIEEKVNTMIAAVPSSQAEKDTLNKQIEVALFEVGKIYKFKLGEPKSSIKTHEKLLKKYPKTKYEPEVLYQLYLTYKDFDIQISQRIGQQIIEKYPNSIYAKLVKNPQYREENHATNTLLKRQYKQLYETYEKGFYPKVISSIEYLLEQHPNNSFSDNLDLLRVLAIGKNTETHQYQFELSNFIKKYPKSELKEHAEFLLATAAEFQQKRVNSARVKFYNTMNQPHFFMIAYDYSEKTYAIINKSVDDYLNKNGFKSLQTGTLTLDEKTATVMVSEFPGNATALSFLKSFNKESNLEKELGSQETDIFVISKDNFEVLFKTKDLDSYLNFYKENYTQ